MKNKKIFSISPALITENLKMNWYLPALAFIVYFMAGIFPGLMDSGLLRDPNQTYMEDNLNNLNPVFFLLLIAVPLIAAVMMMGFMHRPARAVAIHAQPFSRNRIYCSHILTGWIMCVLPVAAMTLLYLLTAGMPGASLYWCLTSTAILTFFYGLFVLAGSLVGNTVMQVLLSGVFFGIVPLIIWLVYAYCDSFLYGFYTIPEALVDFACNSNPIIYLMSNWYGDSISLSLTLTYLVCGLVMLILAGLAYERARLERVGDSMMYRLFEEIITWLIVFVGMTVFGYFFYGTLSSRSMMLVGMAAGALLSFAVVKIIIVRSIKIFTRQNLISLAVFSLLAMIFTGVVIFDLTGYGKWVPDAKDVASVERNTLYYNSEYDYYNFEDGFTDDNRHLTSSEAIEKVVALHEYAANHYLTPEEYGNAMFSQYSDNFTTITFCYEMKNGTSRFRSYHLELTETLTGLLNDVLACEEYRSDASLSEEITAENISYIQFNAYNDQLNREKYAQEYAGNEGGEGYEGYAADTQDVSSAADYEAVITINNQKEIADFLAALRKDDYNRVYRIYSSGEEAQGEAAPGGMNISCTIIMKENANVKKDADTNGGYYDEPVSSVTVDFSVKAQDTQTLALLHDKLTAEGYTKHAKLLEKY